MLKIIIDFIAGILFAYANITIIKKLTKQEIYLKEPTNYILIILIAVILTLFAFPKYNLVKFVLKFSLIMIIDCLIFKENFTKVVAVFSIYLIILIICDSIIDKSILKVLEIMHKDNNLYFYILRRTLVLISLLTITNALSKNKRLSNYIINIKEEINFEILMFFIILWIIIGHLEVNIDKIFTLNGNQLINGLTILIYILFIIIYYHNQKKIEIAEEKTEYVYRYLKEIEDIIDNVSLNNHELKNELASVLGYIEDRDYKNAKKEISKIIKINNTDDKSYLNSIKNIPNGGLKGLLYYKLLKAEENRLNIELDISEEVYKELEEFPEEEKKMAYKILGVYLDNAIEAANDSKRRIFSIEIYTVEKYKIDIVISNTFNKEKLDVNKIGSRGYTTKGNGHGKGIYYVTKLIEKKNYLTESHSIFKDFYIEHLYINNLQFR